MPFQSWCVFLRHSVLQRFCWTTLGTKKVSLCSVCMSSVPSRIYDFASVTEEEGQPTRLICLSEGDPAPDLTFHRTGQTDVYRIGTNVCHQFNSCLCCISGMYFDELCLVLWCCWLADQKGIWPVKSTVIQQLLKVYFWGLAWLGWVSEWVGS